MKKRNEDCRRPENSAADYCRRLKSGIARLKSAIHRQYENTFPGQEASIERAIAEAEASAWATPFPSLFFPALARIRISKIHAPATTSHHLFTTRNLSTKQL